MSLRKKTFTLIEMLIVVVIIGILAATLIPRLQNAESRTRDVIRKKDMKTASDALVIYYQDNKTFPCPNPINDPDIEFACVEATGPKNYYDSYYPTKVNSPVIYLATWWILSLLVPTYISKPFTDPGKSYYMYHVYTPSTITFIANMCGMSYTPAWIAQLRYRVETLRPTDYFRSCPDWIPFEPKANENMLSKMDQRMRWVWIFEDKVMAVGEQYKNLYH